jgi:heme-degrading monooxygenase HmoA
MFNLFSILPEMDNNLIAQTPETPYYAVIFTSVMNNEIPGYSEMADEIEALAKQQEGYLGIESARDQTGITVSYWASLQAIKNWKANARHLVAQKQGREDWYARYKVRICLVERDYEF